MIKKILFFILIFIVLISVLLYYKNTNNINSNTSLLVIDDSKKEEVLHLVLLKYFPKNKKIKILFVNKDVTIIQQKVKSRSLINNYYLQEKDKVQFIQSEVNKLFSSNIKIDNYVILDINTFMSFIDTLNKHKKFKFLIDNYKRNLLDNNKYLETIIYNAKFVRYILSNTNRFLFIRVLDFLNKNRNDIKTNILNKDLLKLYLTIINIKDVSFIDIPTINRRNRLEVDKEHMEETLNLFFKENYTYENKDNIKVEVLNASKKQRLAIKIVDKLRNNKFDVFEWGTYNRSCDYTVIFDFGNNKNSAIKLQNLIGCGEIICRANNKPFADISIVLGKDCNVIDKLDKINKNRRLHEKNKFFRTRRKSKTNS